MQSLFLSQSTFFYKYCQFYYNNTILTPVLALPIFACKFLFRERLPKTFADPPFPFSPHPSFIFFIDCIEFGRFLMIIFILTASVLCSYAPTQPSSVHLLASPSKSSSRVSVSNVEKMDTTSPRTDEPIQLPSSRNEQVVLNLRW